MTARPPDDDAPDDAAPDDDGANSPASQALARGQKGSSVNCFCIAWQKSTSFGQECAKGHLSGVFLLSPKGAPEGRESASFMPTVSKPLFEVLQ
jgi:hypothetical protein